MRRLFALLAVLAMLPSAASAAEPTFTAESQGWWRNAGIVVPTDVGEHIHVQVTIPADGVIVNGPVEVPYVIKMHDGTGAITSFRVSDGSSVKQTWPIKLGPCEDCTVSGTVTVDFSKWGTGRREMRWTANVPKNGEGKRQYQSTGYQVCVRSCTPTYRSGVYIEARGWYADGHDYANARLTSAPSTIRSGGVIRVSLKPGSGGNATKLAGVYIDPDFHNGSAGIVVFERTSAYEGSVTLPTLPPGPHRLVLVSSDGQNAGVLAIPFVTP